MLNTKLQLDNQNAYKQMNFMQLHDFAIAQYSNKWCLNLKRQVLFRIVDKLLSPELNICLVKLKKKKKNFKIGHIKL